MTDNVRPDHDPETVTPVSTMPVGSDVGTVASANAPRRSRTRWLAALAIVALVVVASAATTLMLTGSSSAATVLGYVPTDSVMYGEVRLDLPGDQKRAVGEFLSKFPGFADQAALDTKLDEVLDRLMSDATDAKQTFTRDVKPWFDGELAFAMGPLPDAVTNSDPEAIAAGARALVLISVKDAALARTWFDSAMAQSGAAGTPETYDGVELTVFSEPKMPGAKAAFAIIGGKVAVAGDLTSVKAAVDTKGGAGLAGDPGFAAASTAMDGDRIGFAYVGLRALTDSALKLSQGSTATPPVSDAMLALVPDWAAFRLRVEGDALLLDGAMPHDDAAPGPDENRVNGVAAWAPPGTIALAAGNGYGATILETIDLYRSDPSLKDVFTSLDQGAGVLGGLDAALGWIGDAGIVVARDGDVVEGGIVAIPTDATAARQLLTTIRSFATLGGAQGGVTVRDEDHNGTTITVINLGSASDLAGMAGALGGGTLPSDPLTVTGLPVGDIEIAYAATDGVVVIGSGPDFVKSVLDAGPGPALADDARFRSLLDRVGSQHTGVSYLDVTAWRGLLEGWMSKATAQERAEYTSSVKPFLTPFDAMIGAGTAGGDVDVQHLVITVK